MAAHFKENGRQQCHTLETPSYQSIKFCTCSVSKGVHEPCMLTGWNKFFKCVIVAVLHVSTHTQGRTMHMHMLTLEHMQLCYNNLFMIQIQTILST